MKTQTVELTIDRKKLDEELDRAVDATHPMIALLRLARLLLPKCEQLKTRVVELEKELPFYSLISRSIVGHDGLPKATVGSSDTDLEGRMIEEATREFALTASFFNMGYEKAKTRFAFSSENLVEIFSGSALVRTEATSSLIEAIDAYDGEDYLKALSVLIPQIEAMLRELLSFLAIPVGRRSHRSSANELKNMNDVLSNSRVIATLDEDLHFFLRILFIDKRSYNLRNEFAHGLLPAHAYNWATASLVMMSLVLLSAIGPHCAYTVADLEDDKDDDSCPA